VSGLRLHSTLTRRKEPVEAGPDGVVGIYVCGPTVYSRVHIGNARPFVVFSVMKRYLERQGRRVRLVANITDVNDKIYDAARAEGVPSPELAARYTRAYIEDTDRLGLGRPDAEPLVTTTMPEIIALIGALVERGAAYLSGGDVYFRVSTSPEYGRLSGRRPEDGLVQEPGEGKEHPHDFALWKGRKEGEDAWWDSPFGPGRPGWHIECSAMAERELGLEFAVHGGGIDLVFPHHENEIAQTRGARGRPLARIWAHNEMLETVGEKMSKSLGNIATLAEVLDRWPAETVIAYFLTSHYRSRLPFGDARLSDAQAVCDRLRNALRGLARGIASPGTERDPALTAALVRARREVVEALDDDFSTPGAMAAVLELARVANAAVEGARRPHAGQLTEVRAELVGLLDMLGLAGLDAAEDDVPEEVLALVREREDARAARDFARADALRERVLALGFELRDTPEGGRAYRA
jgi:cysteinyl-tRNA synthetase